MGAEHREKAPWAPAALWNSGDTWAELPGALISGFQLCIWVDTPSLPSLSLLSLLSPHGGQPGRPRTSHLLWSHRGCLRALLDHWENPCVTDFWLLSAPHGFLSPLFTLSLMPFISPVLCSPMFSLTLLLLGCNLQFKVVMRSRAYFSHLPHTVGLINVSPNKILTSLHTCFLSRGDRGCGQERLVRTGSHSSSLLLSPYCLTHLSGNWRPQSLVLKYPFKNQHISWNIGFLVSFGIFFVVVVLFYFINILVCMLQKGREFIEGIWGSGIDLCLCLFTVCKHRLYRIDVVLKIPHWPSSLYLFWLNLVLVLEWWREQT
jgi:hypothetical protein